VNEVHGDFMMIVNIKSSAAFSSWFESRLFYIKCYLWILDYSKIFKI